MAMDRQDFDAWIRDQFGDQFGDEDAGAQGGEMVGDIQQLCEHWQLPAEVALKIMEHEIDIWKALSHLLSFAQAIEEETGNIPGFAAALRALLRRHLTRSLEP
jgi:hypothetical protein